MSCVFRAQAVQRLSARVQSALPLTASLSAHSEPSSIARIMSSLAELGLYDEAQTSHLIACVQPHLSHISAKETLKHLAYSIQSKDWADAHSEFCAQLWDHLYEHRFLFNTFELEAIADTYRECGLSQLGIKYRDFTDNVPKKVRTAKTLKLLGLEAPEGLELSFDFQHNCFHIRREETRHDVVVYGSDHFDRSAIDYGKRLLEHF